MLLRDRARFRARTERPGPEGEIALPEGFELVTVASTGTGVAVEFAADGRMFVAEITGRVRVWQDGQQMPENFIDIRGEVNHGAHRGMLGIALDPDFINNRHVYLLYSVDPIPGAPDESGGTFTRITRYTGTPESNGNIADPASRTVLIGATGGDGPASCSNTHAGADISFGIDGSLLATFGDGANPWSAGDAGGFNPDCFPPNDSIEDIGSFRSQFLGSLSGKVIRVDPSTGLGLATNPYFTGSGADIESKVWAYGLRQPFRFAVRPPVTEGPDTPGVLYIGDVGASNYEEVNVVHGGENFGWPCWEGPIPAFPHLVPAHHGCDTIGTKENPGPLTSAAIVLHQDDDTLSNPQGHQSRTLTGASFYAGSHYPNEYQGRLFICDQNREWIKTAEFDDQHQLVSFQDFADVKRPVDILAHPLNGDLYILDWDTRELQRIKYVDNPVGDANGDDVVDVADLLLLLGGWGNCWGCPQDFDDNGVVDTADLLQMLGNWGTSG